jgi:formylglycine-generating enzyme required for sulfatase activity
LALTREDIHQRLEALGLAPWDWSVDAATKLRNALVTTFGPNPGEELRRIVERSGTDATQIAWDKAAAKELWGSIVEVASSADRLPDVLLLVLAEPRVKVHHSGLRDILGLPPIAPDGGPGGPADPLAVLRDLLAREGLNATVDRDLLDAICMRAPASENLEAYRLARIAHWKRPKYDQHIDRRFTKLTLLIDQGDAATAGRWSAQPDTFDDLGAVLQAVEQRHKSPAMVLLGSPGAGKTTLLRRLEMEQALVGLGLQAETAAGTPPPLTFYLPLNEHRVDDPPPRQWLEERWERAFPDLPGLDELMRTQPVLLLLDALNELPHRDEAHYRERLDVWRDAIKRLCDERAGLRLVFSCRSLNYSSSLSSKSLPIPQVRVEPLSDSQVQAFLNHYIPEDAERLWAQLKDNRQLEFFRLPYYLGLLVEEAGPAGGQIPAGRSALFARFLRRSTLREAQSDNPLFRPDRLLGPMDKRRLEQNSGWANDFALPQQQPFFEPLSRLAHRMQDRSASSGASELQIDYAEAAGLMDLSSEAADQILEGGAAIGALDIDDFRSTLRFTHQLMQEHLAARWMLLEPDDERLRRTWLADDVAEPLAEAMARISDADPLPPLPASGWEETAVMAAEMLPAAEAEAFVSRLESLDLPLAGRCAAAEVKLSPDRRHAVALALIARTEVADADLRARIEAADALGRLGDPRFVAAKGPDGAEYLMPPLVAIPAGKYPIGAKDISGREKPPHDVDLEGFEIGRFPVTNAEYRHFIEAGGYEDEGWWETEDARSWLRGEEDSVAASRQQLWDFSRGIPQDEADFQRWAQSISGITSLDLKNYRQISGLSDADLRSAIADAIPAQSQSEPAFWLDAAFNSPAQPVVGVNWYEARAYCTWLAAQTGRPFRLPSEVESEATARGLEGRTFAFGPEHDIARCNTFETHIRRSTPVGVFPGGQTPLGVHDLSGNVWEWTRSLWGPDGATPIPYPYDPTDLTREDPEAGPAVYRVVRGGSWLINHGWARAAFRLRYPPGYRYSLFGFRVVVSSPISL